MATRYYLSLPDPEQARGGDADLAFRAQGADAIAAELQDALRNTALFERWRRSQPDPDAVDAGARRDRSVGHRRRQPARPAHRPGGDDVDPRQRLQAPHAPARRQRLEAHRRQIGLRCAHHVLLSWSGGKDAAWALHALRQRDDVEVVGLLTTITEGYERVADAGHPRRRPARTGARRGLPVIEARMPQRAEQRRSTSRRSPTRCARHANAGRSSRHIAFGDLFLADIRAYREGAVRAARAGRRCFRCSAPTPAQLARDMIDGGLRAHVCCVDTQQLDAAFSGRAFDAGLLHALPATVDPCGENGEFHTCVWAGPMFSDAAALRAWRDRAARRALRLHRLHPRCLTPISAAAARNGPRPAGSHRRTGRCRSPTSGTALTGSHL